MCTKNEAVVFSRSCDKCFHTKYIDGWPMTQIKFNYPISYIFSTSNYTHSVENLRLQ